MPTICRLQRIFSFDRRPHEFPTGTRKPVFFFNKQKLFKATPRWRIIGRDWNLFGLENETPTFHVGSIVSFVLRRFGLIFLHQSTTNDSLVFVANSAGLPRVTELFRVFFTDFFCRVDGDKCSEPLSFDLILDVYDSAPSSFDTQALPTPRPSSALLTEFYRVFFLAIPFLVRHS